MGMVRASQEYIHAGDIFQIVPSQRFETAYEGDALTLYRTLRDVNPSPYMFCLKLAGRFSLVGSSPEVHVRATDGHVEIRPIAGPIHGGGPEDHRSPLWIGAGPVAHGLFGGRFGSAVQVVGHERSGLESGLERGRDGLNGTHENESPHPGPPRPLQPLVGVAHVHAIEG
jgi:hypothetical protein